ncbi:hypothetical protein CI610_03164 [invertebrate metagenome]|uniref:DUF2306 domain-containing protein n=1 Tax=invertebrate metagenome TaxID=1711999 RepID=A0A2H9T3U8_9ZZZZ
MTYLEVVYIHLGAVVPAFMIGTYLLLTRKGTPKHKILGKVFMLLMLLTAISSLFLPAHVGPALLNHFGFIHLLSIVTTYTVPVAYMAAKKGDIQRHKIAMISLYIGGILLAGSFAFMPGRLLNTWLLG